jgi:Flp pilus assembly protein TadD
MEAAEEYPEFGVEYAKALHERGADEKAIAVLRPLVDSDVYGAALQLGNLLSESPDLDGAIEAYLKGVESKDAHSAMNLAILYHQEGSEVNSRYYKLVARELGDMTEWPDD